MAVYVECTDTFINSRRNTGIQRVVRNIVNNLGENAQDVKPVIFDHVNGIWSIVPGIPTPYERSIAEEHESKKSGIAQYKEDVLIATKLLWNALRYFIAALIPYEPWRGFFKNSKHHFGLNYLLVSLAGMVRRPFMKQKEKGTSAGLKILPGDTLVMLDSSWSNSIWDEVAQLKKQGVRIITVVYDLIPMSHRQFCDDGLVKVFTHWFTCAVKLSDAFVCISDFVRGCVLKELAAIGRENVPVKYFYLGSDLDGIENNAKISEEIASICTAGKKFVLAVGTIEPRKRYDVIVEAFEKYVAAYGPDISLVLVGKIGWKVEALINRIQSNNQFETALFMFNHANDAELNMLYENCSGLIFASDIEGFGLPLVEARQKGIPVIASDIPVFREIADDCVVFFDAGEAESLKYQIRRLTNGEIASQASKMEWLSWKKSAQIFMEKIHELS